MNNSIVMYRNPLEQWWWESGWAWVGMQVWVAAIALLLGLWITLTVLKKKRPRRR